MLTQPINSRQAISILIMFCFGSSVVMGVSTGAEQDAWISLLVSMVYATPVLLMYGRIAQINRGEDIFSAMVSRLGAVVGKVLSALMAFYALMLGALVLRNFSEFIQISSLVATPQIAVMVVMLLTVSALSRMGGKALGKWSLATLPIVLGIVLLTVVLSLNVMDFKNMLPIMEHTPGFIAADALRVFSFPLCETVLLLAIADRFRKEDDPKKIYLTGMLFGGLVLVIIVLRNLFVLGAAVVGMEFFPSYVAARIINLGDFLSRIEGSISINFILAGITKIALCLIAAGKGIAKVFDVADFRALILPTGFAMLALSVTLFDSAMQMFAFVPYSVYFAMPFQIAFPAVLWVVSEIRSRKEKTLSVK